MLIEDGKSKVKLKGRKQRRAGLSREHPFIQLMGKGRDRARDVSANKYKYLGQTIEGKDKFESAEP